MSLWAHQECARHGVSADIDVMLLPVHRGFSWQKSEQIEIFQSLELNFSFNQSSLHGLSVKSLFVISDHTFL